MAKKLSFSVESILSSDNSSSGCCYPSESNGINAVMKGRSYEQRRHSYTSCYERTSDDQPTLPCSPPSSASSTPDLASSAPELYDSMSHDANIEESNLLKSSNAKKGRMRFSPEQIQTLEQRFQEQHYLLPADRKVLALALRMSERQVKTWFQNKRAQCKRSRTQTFHPLLSPRYYNIPYPYSLHAAPSSLLSVADHQKPIVMATQSSLVIAPLRYTPYISSHITGTNH